MKLTITTKQKQIKAHQHNELELREKNLKFFKIPLSLKKK